MHFVKIGSAARSALLAYYFSDTNKSPEFFLRSWLDVKIKRKAYPIEVTNYFSSMLKKVRANNLRVLLPTLTEISENTLVVFEHLSSRKFKDKSMKDRLDELGAILSKNGYMNLIDFAPSDDNPLPSQGNVIYVDSSFYSFTNSGEMPDSITVVVRTDDEFIVAKTAYELGLILQVQKRNNDVIHYWIYPGNNTNTSVCPVTTREAWDAKH